MAIEQPIENWTRFPNCILDDLEAFTPAEFKVLGLMVRKNLGYQNPNKQFSVRYIRDKTGISTPTIQKVLKSLIQKGSISKTNPGDKNTGEFEINWIEPEPCKKITRVNNLHSTVQKNYTEPCKKITQVKENKERKQSKKTFDPYSIEFLLADQMFCLILDVIPGKKKPNLQKWAYEFDKMIRIDNLNPDDIKIIMKWALQDSFWQTNILSPEKLRKHFDRLRLQMGNIQTKTGPGNSGNMEKDWLSIINNVGRESQMTPKARKIYYSMGGYPVFRMRTERQEPFMKKEFEKLWELEQRG